MRAAIIGDGPASNLAALVLDEAGHEIIRFGLEGDKPACPSAAHVHTIDTRLIQVATETNPDFGHRLETALRPCTWHVWRNAEWVTGQIPSISRADFDAKLDQCVRQLKPRQRLLNTDLSTFLSNPIADLVIDATGANRASLPALKSVKIDAFYDEFGHQSVYDTITYLGMENKLRANWKERTRTGLVLAEARNGTLMLTRSSRTVEELSLRLPPHWQHLLAELKPLQRSRYVAPPARWLRTDYNGIGWAAFGDALIQTPPEMGFGLMSLVQQASILKDWANKDGSPSTLNSALASYAELVWMHSAMKDSL